MIYRDYVDNEVPSTLYINPKYKEIASDMSISKEFEKNLNKMRSTPLPNSCRKTPNTERMEELRRERELRKLEDEKVDIIDIIFNFIAKVFTFLASLSMILWFIKHALDFAV